MSAETDTTAVVVDKIFDRTTDIMSQVATLVQDNAGKVFDIAASAIQIEATIKLATSAVALCAAAIVATWLFKKCVALEWDDEATPAFVAFVAFVTCCFSALPFLINMLSTTLWTAAVAPKFHLVLSVMHKAGIQ